MQSTSSTTADRWFKATLACAAIAASIVGCGGSAPAGPSEGDADIRTKRLARPSHRGLDFNGDGRSDILWRAGSGLVAAWMMDGPSNTKAADVVAVPAAWELQRTAGDFDGDGKSDLLWRSDTGQVVIYLMNGSTIASAAAVGSVPLDWRIVDARGDHDGDGRSDILWRSATGLVALWTMNGAAIATAANVAAIGLDWTAVDASGDYDGDGRSDILWRSATGGLAVWFMRGATIAGGGLNLRVGTEWIVVDGSGDYDGDGTSDILWRHAATGQPVVWLIRQGVIAGAGALPSVGHDWSVADAAGDFNGDGKSDLLWRSAGGSMTLWTLDGVRIQGATATQPMDWHWRAHNAPASMPEPAAPPTAAALPIQASPATTFVALPVSPSSASLQVADPADLGQVFDVPANARQSGTAHLFGFDPLKRRYVDPQERLALAFGETGIRTVDLLKRGPAPEAAVLASSESGQSSCDSPFTHPGLAGDPPIRFFRPICENGSLPGPWKAATLPPGAPGATTLLPGEPVGRGIDTATGRTQHWLFLDTDGAFKRSGPGFSDVRPVASSLDEATGAIQVGTTRYGAALMHITDKWGGSRLQVYHDGTSTLLAPLSGLAGNLVQAVTGDDDTIHVVSDVYSAATGSYSTNVHYIVDDMYITPIARDLPGTSRIVAATPDRLILQSQDAAGIIRSVHKRSGQTTILSTRARRDTPLPHLWPGNAIWASGSNVFVNERDAAGRMVAARVRDDGAVRAERVDAHWIGGFGDGSLPVAAAIGRLPPTAGTPATPVVMARVDAIPDSSGRLPVMIVDGASGADLHRVGGMFPPQDGIRLELSLAGGLDARQPAVLVVRREGSFGSVLHARHAFRPLQAGSMRP